MQDTIRVVIGNGLSTRLLGWCSGEVSDFEIYKELRNEAKLKGINYEIPKEILSAL